MRRIGIIAIMLLILSTLPITAFSKTIDNNNTDNTKSRIQHLTPYAYMKNPPDSFKRVQFEYHYSPDVRNIVKFSIQYNKYPNTYQQYFGMDFYLIAYTLV